MPDRKTDTDFHAYLVVRHSIKVCNYCCRVVAEARRLVWKAGNLVAQHEREARSDGT